MKPRPVVIRSRPGDNPPTSTLHYGRDVREVLRELPRASIQTICTSPPYWGLRDYGTEPVKWADGAECSLGQEPTPEAFCAHLVEIFREVRRVLRDNGTLWLNLGDSYSQSGRGASNASTLEGGLSTQEMATRAGDQRHRVIQGCKPKDLVGIPWRVAFALQADGWYLRQDIIWSKPNPMPESVRDRCTKSHEYVFLLSKQSQYFYDQAAVKEPLHGAALLSPDGKRNRRSVWTINSRPYRGAHFATWPEALVEPMIRAGCSEKGHCPKCGAQWEQAVASRSPESTGASTGGDPARKDGGTRERAAPGSGGGNTFAQKRVPTGEWQPACDCELAPVRDVVLDLFSGSATTGVVANRLGHNYVGIDLNADYLPLAERRLRGIKETVGSEEDEPIVSLIDLFATG
jgi:DNA modification methylase